VKAAPEHAAQLPPVARTPLSRAQFVRAANGICRRSSRQGNALFMKPKSLHMLTREMRMAVPPLDRRRSGLRSDGGGLA
jgi:hypothetical protein